MRLGASNLSAAALVVASFSLAVAGCSGEGALGGASGQADGADLEVVPGDAPSGVDQKEPGTGGQGDDTIASGGKGGSKGGGAPVEEPVCDEAPYDFRCPCGDNTDCASGWCIEDVVGLVCTVACLEDCPEGWTCRSVQNMSEDVVYLCVPDVVDLCKECTSDQECGGPNDLCVSVGATGTYCLADCTEDADCPDGYECGEATGASGAVANQCLPVTESCVCTPDLLGATQACSVKNDLGTCFGETTCTGPDGWSACTAKPAAEEVCDGLDNDCDGLFDEDTAECTIFFEDQDEDGFGNASSARCLCGPDGAFDTDEAGDCNDEDASLSPKAAESCDGVDNNCNGLADEGCDKDEDGFCDAAMGGGGSAACPKGGGDCNDLDGQVNPQGFEKCDEIDNDCDGKVDEDVQAPCGGCSKLCQLEAGPDGGDAFQADGANGTGITPEGFVQIDAQSLKLHMLWVANSGENTLSKIDTETGKEVGRYTICNDPSRTAVDLNGDCWVGCRGDGKVAKIALEQSECVDKNGDGQVVTSWDQNGNGKIDGAEMLPFGEDECVLMVVQPETGSKARAVAVDSENHPWVGYYESRKLLRLDPTTGEVVATVDFSSLTNGKIYGMAIDQKGHIWISLRDGSPPALGVVDITTFPMTPKVYATPNSHQTYGIAVDSNGRVWLAGGEAKVVSRFDPATETWKTMDLSAYPFARGVAASTDGLVYVAHHDFNTDCVSGKDHYISVFDAANGNFVYAIDTATGNDKLGPVGLAIDFDDHLWAINHCASSATKIDRKTNKVVGHYPTGKNPYTYSDMTGFALKTVVAPEGSYVHTFEGWGGLTTQWHQISASALTPNGTSISVRYRTANSPSDFAATPWSATLGPFPPVAMPINLTKVGQVTGKYLQIEVKLTSGAQGTTPVLKSIDAVATAVE